MRLRVEPAVRAEVAGQRGEEVVRTIEVGRLVGLLPDTVVKVAESGISGTADAARYAREGADVVLVGEALVKHGDPTGAVAAMREVAART